MAEQNSESVFNAEGKTRPDSKDGTDVFGREGNFEKDKTNNEKGIYVLDFRRQGGNGIGGTETPKSRRGTYSTQTKKALKGAFM